MISKRAKNFIALLTSNFGVQALRFFTITLIARRLGSEIFGVYNYVILIVSYGFMLVEFGLKNVAIREFAQSRGSRNFVWQIFKIRSGLAMAAVGTVVLLTNLAFPVHNYFLPSLFIAGSLFIDAFLTDYILIAREDLSLQAIANVTQALFLFIACTLFLKSNSDFLLAGEFFFLSHIIWTGIFFLATQPFQLPSGRNLDESRDANNIWKTAINGAPFMVATLVSGIQSSLDLLLLGQFHYNAWLGDYGAALKILGITLGIINSLLASVQPRLAKHSHSLHSTETKELLSSTARFLWLLIAPTIVGCYFLGPELVLWIFGSEYKMAGNLLRPLSFSFGFLCLALIPMHALFVSSDIKAIFKLVFYNCLLGFILVGGSLVLDRPELVPWMMACTQLAYMFFAWNYFGSTKFISVEDFKSLTFPLGLMIIPLFSPGSLIARVTVSVMGYGAGLLFMRIWKRPWFQKVLGHN